VGGEGEWGLGKKEEDEGEEEKGQEWEEGSLKDLT
jgi:hypothetical protein